MQPNKLLLLIAFTHITTTQATQSKHTQLMIPSLALIFLSEQLKTIPKTKENNQLITTISQLKAGVNSITQQQKKHLSHYLLQQKQLQQQTSPTQQTKNKVYIQKTHTQLNHLINLMNPGQNLLTKAQAHHKQGQHQQAEQYYLQTLKVRIQQLGPTHPDTINTYLLLGHFFHQQKKYKEALECYTKTLHIQKAQNTDTSQTHLHIGTLHHNLHQYKQAEKHLLKAYHIKEYTLGKTHPHTTSSLKKLQQTQKKLKEKTHPLFNFMSHW